MSLMNLKAGDNEPSLGKNIKEVIIADDSYIVYMDSEGTIQWTTEGYSNFSPDFGKIQNQISFWESVCNKVFCANEAYTFKTLLAEGYARILDEKKFAPAQQIIDDTKERIKSVGEAKVRVIYLLSGFITSLVACFAFMYLWIDRDAMKNSVGEDAFQVIACSIVGSIGAFISTFIRAKNYKAEITAGTFIHSFDGVLRIFYGLIAGCVICLAIKSNFTLGFINSLKRSFPVELFMSMVGGASEILVPSIVKKVEGKV